MRLINKMEVYKSIKKSPSCMNGTHRYHWVKWDAHRRVHIECFNFCAFQEQANLIHGDRVRIVTLGVLFGKGDDRASGMLEYFLAWAGWLVHM